MQQRLEPIILKLLNFIELDEQDWMSRDFSRLKIELKRTFTLLRKQVKELNTRKQQENTSSEQDPKKSITHDDNIRPHQQQQPRLNFVLLRYRKNSILDSASAPAGSSFAVN